MRRAAATVNNATPMIATSRSDDSVEQFKETHILRDVSCSRENAVFYCPFTPLSFDLFRPVIYRRTLWPFLCQQVAGSAPGWAAGCSGSNSQAAGSPFCCPICRQFPVITSMHRTKGRPPYFTRRTRTML